MHFRKILEILSQFYKSYFQVNIKQHVLVPSSYGMTS